MRRAVRVMDEGMLVRMRGAELIGEAERERLARQARGPARVPGRAGAGRARSLMLAAARWWRRPAAASGAARSPRHGPGSWSPAGGGKVAGRTR
jgi:hypothetical protein